MAKRLRASATASQIRISWSTWERVQDRFHANPLPSWTLKGWRAVTEVFELVDLLPEPMANR